MEQDHGVHPLYTFEQPSVAGSCSVCGGFKLSHQEFCTECERHKDAVEARRKQAARVRRFGKLY